MTAASNGTRERIIAAATGAFRRRGVAGPGIAEICNLAGVTKGVFSYHFPGGKEQLVVEVVKRNGDDVAALFTAPADTAGGTPGEAVAAAFAAYADLLRDKGTDFGCPIAASVVDASATSDRVRDAASNVFQRWTRGWEVDSSNVPNDVATLVIAALEGAIIVARAHNDPEVLDRIGAALGRWVDAGS
jgi:TetR/AcrR family transcriptional repressor of lmrAB and yxaGH operons